MTMFEELFALACSATLTMTVSADQKSGHMTINVIPKPKQNADETALAQPLSLTAAPQEFDAGFIEALQGYREARLSLAQQAEATKLVIEAAKAASVRKASDTTAKASKSPAGRQEPAPAAPATGHAEQAADDAEGMSPREPGSANAASGESFDLFG